MKNKNTLRLCLTFCSLAFLCLIGIPGCQANNETPALPVETQAMETEAPNPGASATPGNPPDNLIAPTATVDNTESDPIAIQAAWQSSPHADSFVLDENGQNNTCARCHAPINWLPSMDDLPESCYACKFELEPPPPTIAEAEWVDIPCKVCHKVDKKGNVEAEYAWLEIAPLDEYISVASPTELCLKCHAPTSITGHGSVQLGGDHPDYVCTDCHSAHDTKTSCVEAGCHNDVLEPASPIAGHDDDHKVVACVACHDGSAMEVGPIDETGLWTTFESRQTDAGLDRFPFTSHNVVLDAPCVRCHYTDNPWGLSSSLAEP